MEMQLSEHLQRQISSCVLSSVSAFLPPFLGETPQLPTPDAKVSFGSGRKSFSAEV